jgi:hypothetical protein
MREAFVNHKFSAASARMIGVINEILEEYRAQRYVLSLRQLYYQLVARDHIENTVRSYKNIGSLVSKGRDAGLIDWDMIEDRGRVTSIPSHWKSPADILDSAAYSFRIDMWENQPWHVEVMVEKDALSGILQPICASLDVGITANKGYSSSSALRETAIKLAHAAEIKGKKNLVIYLGDHDPSGIDMTRDIEDRLKFYSRLDSIKVERIALNMDQVQAWRPPENPAKQTDARFKQYAKKYGQSSWELDAVSPERLSRLLRDIIIDHRDPDLYLVASTREQKMRDDLRQMATDYRAQQAAT